jgi:6-pyruvoyltetrahydropterin/6-carboxytetrahydropterin synthase
MVRHAPIIAFFLWIALLDSYKIPLKVQILHEDIKPEQLRYHSKRVAVTKEFTFSAAHHLHLYAGNCKSLHGHTYRLVITMSGHLDERGICVDFNDVRMIFEEVLKPRLDHRYLNEVLPPMNTTVENMIVWIWENLEAEITRLGAADRSVRLEELVLYETPTSSARLTREWMSQGD